MLEYFTWLEQEAEEQRREEHEVRVERFLPQRLRRQMDKHYELVEATIKVASCFLADGHVEEALAEMERAQIYLQELNRMDDGRIVKFICVDCGKLFTSLDPPAETREDDPEPQCSSCIEKDLDAIDAEPLDDETIERIVAKVLKRGTR